jgi:hypothetical protein
MRRNLIALLLAAMLSVGTIGVAMADDGGGDRLDSTPGTSSYIEREVAH